VWAICVEWSDWRESIHPFAQLRMSSIRSQRVIRPVLASGVFVCSFLFRFIVPPDLTNDFFMHVVRGRQMLLGELPFRDFSDPGLPLMYAVSAFAEAVGGHSLLSELTVSLVFMSLGAVLVFLLATEASRSQTFGLTAAVLTVVIAPRVYAYPKVFLYPLAVWAMWRYLERPSRARVGVLAACTAIAWLFRHDHGVYIGAAVVMMLFLRHRAEGLRVPSRAAASFMLVSGLLLAPYLLFIQVNGGLVTYLQTGLEFSRDAAGLLQEAPRFRGGEVRWLAVRPPPDPPRTTVNVRWSPELAMDEASRAALERHHGLMRPDAQGDRSWTYDLHDTSPENVMALVQHIEVEDTAGVDRATGAVPPPTESWHASLRRVVPLLRLRLGEGVGRLMSANALTWLFYLFYSMPLIAIGLLLVRRGQGTFTKPDWPAGTDKVLVLALLALMANVGMLRAPLTARIADVAGLAAIVGAWLAGQASGGQRSVRLLWRGRRLPPNSASPWSLREVGWASARGLLGVAVLVVTCHSVAEIGRLQTWIEHAGFDERISGRQIATLGARAYDLLSTSPPLDAWAPPGSEGVRGLTRYVSACTRPTDRVFVAGFLSEILFYSARGFAGGQSDYLQGISSSLTDQRRVIARLGRQSVPIVLVRDELASNVPFIDAYLRRRYAVVPGQERDSASGLTLMVERGRTPTGLYGPLDLPCYS